MIVDCAIYREGMRVGGTISPEAAGQALAEEADTIAWIRLHEPSHAELEQVGRCFELPELAMEDAVHAHQRPKLESYDEDLLFLVLKTARYVDRDEVVELGEILLFVGRRFVVSVRHGGGSALEEVQRRVEADPQRLALGASALLHAIVDHVVDGYGPAVDGIDRDIEELEEVVFSPIGGRQSPIERLYYLKREVSDFHRATGPLLAPLSHLAERSLPQIHEDVREYLRDVHDHLLRIDEQLAAFRDLLTTILEAHLAQISVRQNEDMRKISAWVAIAAVPTMIAGIYGMNFQHMPELTKPWGYPLVVGAMVAICLGLFFFFRRRGWL